MARMKKHERKYNENNLAIAYYRYSSESQNDASIEQQREAVGRYAKSKGLQIVKEYWDEAMSGTDDDRPYFQLMLKEAEIIKPSQLLVWKRNRFGRNMEQVTLNSLRLRRAGVRLTSITEPISTEDELMARVFEVIIDSQSEKYSLDLSKDIRRGNRDAALKAKFLGHKLFGYKKGDDGRYAIDETTAPVVVRAFNDYANGVSLKEIAETLNKEGWRTTRGYKFTHNSLRSILHNSSYYGLYTYGDVVIENGMPAIVDKDLFDQVQDRFSRNKHGGAPSAYEQGDEDASRYWLSGKLYCGHCGERMQGVYGKSSSKSSGRYYYYSCANKRVHLCNKKNVRKDVIETAIIRFLHYLLNDDASLAMLAVDTADYYKKTVADDTYLKALQSSLKSTETGIANIVKAVEAGMLNESLMARLTELENQKNDLLESIDAEKAKKRLANDEHSIKAYFERYRNANLEDETILEYVLNYFIDKIYLYDDHMKISGWFEHEHFDLEYEQIKDGSIDFKAFEPSGPWKFDNFALGSTTPIQVELGFVKNHFVLRVPISI